MNPQVTCGCGRAMTLDPIRGRGAFRCGCGARIKVAVQDEKRCAGYRDSKRCRSAIVQGLPVDLCADHADVLRQLWRLDFSQRQREWAENEYGSETMNRADEAKQKIWDACQDPAARPDPPRVYYLRFGDRIKIGTTTNLRRRLQSIPHDRVLAVEPGDVTVERMRHREFGSLRITGEWFRPGEELMSHIAELNRKPAQ